MAELAGGCVAGCLVGALGCLNLSDWSETGRQSGLKNRVAKLLQAVRVGKTNKGSCADGSNNGLAPQSRATDAAASYASPRFPFSSPGPGWRAFQSPVKRSPVNLGAATLSTEKADLCKLDSMTTELAEEPFISVLGKLIGVAEYLQNNPRLNITPDERKACNICLDELRPYSTANGGPLIIEELEYVSGRPNLKITYPGTGSKTISFVGSHFDVVPADKSEDGGWNVDPFKLSRDGDKLFGRGTTDCLGHVALITRMLAELGKSRPKLKNSIIVVFIAAEEGGETGVGVDMVVKNGKMDDAKKGPVYWVDSADSHPCCGTAGSMSWSLSAKGRLFHSGFPNKGINSIELISDAVAAIQERFYDDFPPVSQESDYGFQTGSSMKPTQVECKKGSFNQICPEATMHGDIRLSPFYDVAEVKKAIEGYIADMNAQIDLMPTRGPYSKYELGEEIEVQPGELKRGKIEIKWNGTMETFRAYEGIAVDLNSAGHKALVQAVRETLGQANPYSISGSLPLVKTMQKAGFDLQLCGFGLMKVYHGVDEYCTLSDMKNAYQVLLRMICLLETTA